MAHDDERTTKRVPKGTSQYQAAWIMDNGSEVCVGVSRVVDTLFVVLNEGVW